ncbi:hypothetical protein SK128_007958, partial [Halocaridina rubra]
MDETKDFEYIFSKLLNKLKKTNKVLEVSSHFGPNHSLEDMFSYLWHLEETHSYLRPCIQRAPKSEDRAEKFRAEGNKFYQKKWLHKALELYNLSIIFASHPEIVPDEQICSKISVSITDSKQPLSCYATDDKEYKALALAFANRSAVLLELRQYAQCIQDINYAIMYGYPKLLQSKLAERKAKCMLCLGRKEEARQLIEAAIQSLCDLNLDETKIKFSREALNKLLLECQSHDQSGASVEKNLTEERIKIADMAKDEILFVYESPDPPVLDNFNAAIPNLSDAVALQFSSSQGRYLRAERDIEQGELLVVEEAYSSVLLLDSSLTTHCCVCLKRSLSPLPCCSCPT